MRIPFNLIDVLPREVGSGKLVALAVELARLVPKMDTRLPGATGPGMKLAALITSPMRVVGAGTGDGEGVGGGGAGDGGVGDGGVGDGEGVDTEIIPLFPGVTFTALPPESAPIGFDARIEAMVVPVAI